MKLSTFRPSGPLLGLLTLLALFVVLLAWRGQAGQFFSLGNMQVLLHKNSLTAVAALGMLVVLVAGGIDLSVGSVAALVTVTAMQSYRLVHDGPEYALPEWLIAWLESRNLTWEGTGSPGLAGAVAAAVGLTAGVTCGLVNGLVVTRLKIPPFVATLGMLSVARGLAVWFSGRTRVSFRGARPGWVEALSTGSVSEWWLFDPGVWSVVGLAAVVAVALSRTVYGRACYAVGANEQAARLAGIGVERTRLATYVVAGFFTGWAGLMFWAHGNGGDPNVAVGFELDVIAAVVIGGAALSGGVGTVTGTMLGVLILGILENGVSFFDVPVEVKYILVGAIVVVNTALSARRGKE